MYVSLIGECQELSIIGNCLPTPIIWEIAFLDEAVTGQMEFQPLILGIEWLEWQLWQKPSVHLVDYKRFGGISDTDVPAAIQKPARPTTHCFTGGTQGSTECLECLICGI